MINLKEIELDPELFENKNSYKAACWALEVCVELQRKAREGYKLVTESGLEDIKFRFKNGNELILNNTWIFGDVRALNEPETRVYVTKKGLKEYLKEYSFIRPKDILTFNQLLRD